MRRSAAALLARPAAASTPPKVEGVEDVRAAVTATMLAIDSKLAAVRAAVAGGPVAPAAGPPPIFHNPAIAHAAAGAGVAMRRSGSEPELRGRLASPSHGNCAPLDPHESAAAVDAVVAGAMHGVRRRWLQAARSSSAGSGRAPAAADSSPTSPAGHLWTRGGSGGGGSGGGGGSDSKPEVAPGLWRQLPQGQMPPSLAADAASAAKAQDFTGVCGGGTAGDGDSDLRPGRWSGSRQRMPLSGGGGGGAPAAAPDDCGGEGGLSPRGPGPMLAGRGGRGMGRT